MMLLPTRDAATTALVSKPVKDLPANEEMTREAHMVGYELLRNGSGAFNSAQLGTVVYTLVFD